MSLLFILIKLNKNTVNTELSLTFDPYAIKENP